MRGDRKCPEPGTKPAPGAHTCASSLPDYDVFTRIPLQRSQKRRETLLFTMSLIRFDGRSAEVAETCHPRSFSFAEASEKHAHSDLILRSPRARQDGGARRDRTDDLMLAKHALYQLSYGPSHPQEAGTLRENCSRRSDVCPPKVPPSPRLRRMRPAKRRRREEGWWAQADSNCRPHAYQACALTT